MSASPMSSNTMRSKRKPIAIAILVVIAWFGVTGFFGPLFGKLTSVQENDNSAFLPDSAESTKAVKLLESFAAGESTAFPTLVLLEGSVGPEVLQQINAHLETVPDLKLGGTDVPLSKYLLPGSQVTAFPAPDGKAVLASILLDGAAIAEVLPNDEPVLPAIVEALREDFTPFAKDLGFDSYVTGAGGLIGDLFGAFGDLDSTLLLTTLGVVAFILIIVYRSPILWFLPLLSAVFALSTAGGIIYLLAKNDVIDVNGQSQGILSVLVLGAGTDYALLLISRYREELHHHSTPVAAMRAAYRGTFEPIVASGATVALGLLVLLLSDLSGNRGLGPIGAIGVAVAVITMVTLLPAFLVLFGRWIFWPRIPRFDDVDSQLTGTWAKVGNIVERRPRRAWVVTGLLLVVLAGFSTTLKTDGLSTSESFTGNPESVVGQKLLENHFPGGEGDPTKVILKNELIPAVSAKLQSVAGVTAVAPEANAAGVIVKNGLSILNVTLSTAPDSRESRDRIPAIREAVKSIDDSILVGGTTAVFFDTDVAARHDNRTVIPVVLLLITLILGLLLRSIVSAVLLLGTVVLSYFATLGVCALVFNHIFGFAGADASFPLFAFIFLVALGIDYNIFLMTRVREESGKMGTRKGVIKGLTVTGSVITSAGIVLAATFGVLGILPLVFLAELGFAVAFGVLLDTIIVRSILVPALVHEIGPKVWWPSKLSKSAD
jgi:putative drug exporter of the RND superfamily|uniref:MMPL family transporter n=1 Tax=Candidatus Planktophila sp. TaxID=2175601 RepID=UPI0040492C41